MAAEERWIKKAIAGSGRAYGKLVKLYQDKILFLCFDLLGDYEEAKDASQEIFLKVYQKMSGFREESRFGTWLYRIAVNHCTDINRSRSGRKVYDLDFLESERAESKNMEIGTDAQQEFLLEMSELKDKIDLSLKELSQQQQTAIVLKYYHDLSTGDISDIMQCSPGTVRVHLYRGLNKLKVYWNTIE